MTKPKLWVDLERVMVESVLAGLPWSPMQTCPATITLHPTFGATLRVVKRLFSPSPSPLAPVLGVLCISTWSDRF